MRILIDADGCPVTKAAIKIADKHNIEAVIFCDTSHIFDYPGIKVITVGNKIFLILYVLYKYISSPNFN